LSGIDIREIMTDTRTTTDDLLRRATAGDAAALGELFGHYRERLHRMVRLRLDRRVAGRLDPSDVLQDAYLDVARRFPEYIQSACFAGFGLLGVLVGLRMVIGRRARKPG
jgi:RNA polymerase sigma-70 factor, ECF subfamily